jgi:hypothetical protein
VTVREAIRSGLDLLVVDRSGKTEAGGAGLRPFLADGFKLGIPVQIAMPWHNIESWRQFADLLAVEIAGDAIDLAHGGSVPAVIGLVLSARTQALNLHQAMLSPSKPG